jgi:hypothetical protein
MLTKKVWINFMLARNRTGLDSEVLNSLLDRLSLQELKILKKNDDLMDRVTEICKMTSSQLMGCLRDEYGFEINDCQNGDLWIDAGDANEPFVSDWVKEIKLPHDGWYVTTDPKTEGIDQFVPWARNLLMQEVRVNAALRYFKHKLSTASVKKGKNPFEEDAPWGGSGGNYI